MRRLRRFPVSGRGKPNETPCSGDPARVFSSIFLFSSIFFLKEPLPDLAAFAPTPMLVLAGVPAAETVARIKSYVLRSPDTRSIVMYHGFRRCTPRMFLPRDGRITSRKYFAFRGRFRSPYRNNNEHTCTYEDFNIFARAFRSTIRKKSSDLAAVE